LLAKTDEAVQLPNSEPVHIPSVKESNPSAQRTACNFCTPFLSPDVERFPIGFGNRVKGSAEIGPVNSMEFTLRF
jgi:hypothetical protein